MGLYNNYWFSISSISWSLILVYSESWAAKSSEKTDIKFLYSLKTNMRMSADNMALILIC